MKNTIKVFGVIAIVAIIGFAMTACGDDDVTLTSEDKEATTTGQLTITGLDAYNNKKIKAFAGGFTWGNLYAYQTAYNTYSYEDGKLVNISGGIGTDGIIKNGQVILKVFRYARNSYGNSDFGSYTGNDQNVNFGWVTIDGTVVSQSLTVNFTNGVGSGALAD
jgi:hypothetical protein